MSICFSDERLPVDWCPRDHDETVGVHVRGDGSDRRITMRVTMRGWIVVCVCVCRSGHPDGGWGPKPPFHTSTFVVTHRSRSPIEVEGATTFHFIDASPAEAFETAREAGTEAG
jgi:hypothetical protein